MALTSSHPFRLAAAATAEPRRRPKPLKFVVQAKQDPPFSFKFGKRGGSGDEGSPAGGGESQTGLSFFDFNGKFPEVAKSLVPVVSSRSVLGPGLRRKDPNTVFVAGASGLAGVRIAQTLLRQGFAVRAGVPDLATAQELAQLAVKYKVISPEESRRLNAVESPLRDAEAIARAIGNAGKVVVTVGRGESGPTGEVTAEDALEVVRGAQLSGTRHVALVYDTASTGLSGGSTYNVWDGLTSFFSNLFSPTQLLTLPELLSKIAEVDVSCTVLKAALTDDYAAEGGYEIAAAPEGGGGRTTTTDAFKVAVLSIEGRWDVSDLEGYKCEKGSLAGKLPAIQYLINILLKVTKSQIASLVAGIFSNVEVAENRVVEISTSPSATSKTIEEIFSSIPKDGRRKAYLEALEKAKVEEKAKADEEANKQEEKVEKFPKQKARAFAPTEETSKQAEAIGSLLNGDALRQATQDLNIDFSWEKLSSQLKAVAQVTKSNEPKVQVATIGGQVKARALPPRKAVVKSPSPRRASTPPPPKREKEVRKMFGGLFKQDTIYVDDD